MPENRTCLATVDYNLLESGDSGFEFNFCSLRCVQKAGWKKKEARIVDLEVPDLLFCDQCGKEL
jgi:hypothetical protein